MSDLVPRVVDAAEWALVSRGVQQRVRVIEAFLADVYGPGRAFDHGVVPWRLLHTSGQFRREVAGFQPPNGVRCHVSGTDLIKDQQGTFRVIGHDVRLPSGVSRVTANRLVPSIGDVDEYPSRLLSALRAAAPNGVNDPFIVVLGPGPRDAAYAEHTLIAGLMGVGLAEGRDLSCSRNRVFMRTTRGPRPVDVIFRQVDDDWLDPLQFRPRSALGCPGLVNAARAGNVTIANGIGNGVADDTRIHPYLPGLIRYYLGEEPVLENAEPGRPGDPDTAGGHTRLRAFAVNDGRGVWVLPGVAREPGGWP